MAGFVAEVERRVEGWTPVGDEVAGLVLSIGTGSRMTLWGHA